MSSHRDQPEGSRSAWLLAIGLGPMAAKGLLTKALGLSLIVFLILLTQVGGLLVWPALGLASLRKTHRWVLGTGLALIFYFTGSILIVPPLALLGGRQPLPLQTEDGLGPRSPWFAILNRHYVRVPIRIELVSIAREVRVRNPQLGLRYLDASFPFASPLPMLPHISHGDGRNVDLALPLLDPQTRESRAGGGSPIGYWGYISVPPPEADRPDPCGLRWDIPWLQSIWEPVVLDRQGLTTILEVAARSARVERMLLEGRLVREMSLEAPTLRKVRDQGPCAARHDDHLHVRFQ